MYTHARESYSRDKRSMRVYLIYAQLPDFPELSSSFTHQTLTFSVENHSLNVFVALLHLFQFFSIFLTMMINIPVKLSDLIIYATKFC